MNEGKGKTYLRILANYVIFILILLFVFKLLPKMIVYFLPFVIAIIIAMIANPLVHFLEKKVKLVRKAGSVIIIVLVIAAIIAIMYGLIAWIISEIVKLYENKDALVAQFGGTLKMITVKLNEFLDSLPFLEKEETDKAFSLFDGNSVKDWLNKALDFEKVMTGVSKSGVIGGSAEAILIVFITVLAAYFFTADHDKIMNKLKNIAPSFLKEYYEMISMNFKRAVGGYLKAQIKLMFIIMAVLFVGLLILRVDYAILLAFLIAFLDFLPVFGTGTVLWPWIAIDVLSGNYTQAVGLAVIYILCQVVRQALQPKMVGDSIGLNPLATLFFMYTGYKYVGNVFGMIIGIPIGMVIISLYQAGVFSDLIKGAKIVINDLNEFRKF